MRLKRFIAGVISAALALSVCALPAAAEGTTTTSTINKDQKGSLTIYKYSQTSEQEAQNPKPGNGNGESTTINKGELLEGAQFTLYQVKDADALVTYYDGLTSDNPEVTAATYFTNWSNDKTENGLSDGISAFQYKEDGTKEITAQKTTDKTGTVTFTNLPVGLYLVIETVVPQSVTKPVEPFLVSIPMTRIGDSDTDDTTNGNLKQWLYDVKVYPKNSTAKGTVKLAKNGVSGNKTTSLKGLQFKLYVYDGTTYKPYKDTDGTSDKIWTTNESGEITATDLAKGKYYFQEVGYETGSDAGYIIDSKTKYMFEVDNQGKVIESTDTDTDKAGAADFTIANDGTLTVKNYKPDFSKTVYKRNGELGGRTGINGNDADYAIGDDVKYELKISVPANVARLKTFKVTDTTNADQLKHNIESVTVSGVKADGATNVTFEKNTDYTVTDTSTTGENATSQITINFKGLTNSTALAECAGGTITITYTAKLQNNAVVGANGNVNSADLLYSRKTDITDEEEDNPYVIEDKGVVYTFKTNIEKVGQDGQTTTPLVGVTFDLYKKYDEYNDTAWKDGETTKGVTFKGSNIAFCENPTALGLPAGSWFKVETLTTVDEGKVSSSGLPAGEYMLVETKTNTGYNLLSEPVDAKLNLEYKTTWKSNAAYDSDGKLTKYEIQESKVTEKDDEDKTYNVSDSIKIVNRKGFTLPVTGGFGTLLFSGIGVLLVLAGVVMLFSLKKKNNRA